MAKRQSMIHVRNGFSEAHGMGTCNTQMQYDDLDDRTRKILFNSISKSLDDQFRQYDYMQKRAQHNAENDFCRVLLTLIFEEKLEADKYYYIECVVPFIERVMENAVYNEVFDLIEAICKFRYNRYYEKELKTFFNTLNWILESEYVGYRFIEGRFTPITDKNEIAAIEEACDNTYQGPRTHISKAVALISDREHKDYKNCIKESISAVESICSIIVGNESATLGSAIKQLKDKGLKIHSALEGALSRLYGYTSDEGGIRHAEGMFETEVTFEEAKFMLVSCSAFVNYLTANYGKVGGDHA